jgi:hypothetical protein
MCVLGTKKPYLHNRIMENHLFISGDSFWEPNRKNIIWPYPNNLRVKIFQLLLQYRKLFNVSKPIRTNRKHISKSSNLFDNSISNYTKFNREWFHFPWCHPHLSSKTHSDPPLILFIWIKWFLIYHKTATSCRGVASKSHVSWAPLLLDAPEKRRTLSDWSDQLCTRLFSHLLKTLVNEGLPIRF